MYGHQRPGPYIYNTSPYGVPTYATVSYPPSPIDIHWYNAWPRVRTILLSITMLICSAALISLDIANLAIEGNKQNDTTKFGLGTGKVGAGIWSGSVSFFASIFILAIVFLRNKRVASTFALITVTLAFLFMIALVGLSGNTVQNNLYLTNLTEADKTQHKILIAILSVGSFVMILSMTMEKNEYALDYVLQAEYNLLRKQFIPGIIVIPSGKSNLIWNGVHFVSQGPYEGGVFRFSIVIPNTFPDSDCPKVLFLSSIYHPQIDEHTGELDIKRYFPVWKRNGHHLWQVLRYIRRIFQKIEATNAINLNAAHLYEQDPEIFLSKVSECVNESKSKLYNSDPSISDDPHAILFSPWSDKLQTVRQLLLSGKKEAFDHIRGLSWMKPGVHQILAREDALQSH